MQRPCPSFSSLSNMQNIRSILSRTSISLLSESKLIHYPPILYIDAAKRLSSHCLPTISYFYQRAFHSGDREEEEDNAAARAWALCESTPEKIADMPESGKGADSSHLAEEKVPLKEKLRTDPKEDDVETEGLMSRSSLTSRAGGRVAGKKTGEKFIREEEEDNAAARAWNLCDSTSEKIADMPESGKGADSSHLAEEKAPLKEKLRTDSKEDDVETEGLMSRSSLTSRAGGRVPGKKTGEKVVWVCVVCGANQGKWWGTCPVCQTGSLTQSVESKFSKPRGERVLGKEPMKAAVPQRLMDVTKGMNQSEWRLPLDGHLGMEVARVIGGGIVPGSLILLGGDPGVGKSTLLLQIAAIISQHCSSSGPGSVLYVSGEESLNQIGNRAERVRITSEDLYLYSSTEVEDILNKVQELRPAALIVDSIHTIYLRDVIGSAGNITQVKECTLKLLHFAKQTNIPVLLIGHVTKTGDIAGPRMLEHMVDVVLYMEGERFSSYRLLRSVKNRFGTADELGLLEMTESGFQAVSNPSEMFLRENYFDSDILAGLALAIVVDGCRAFVIEIQALCVSGSSVARHINGIQESRADMIISVLMKQAGLKLQDNAVYLNVVSGFKLTETAGDLAIAAAICSSFLEFPIPHGIAFVGEVGLAGELRTVQMMDKRVSAAAKLGFHMCIVPEAAKKGLSALNLNIQIIGCRDLKGLINTVFATP